MAVRYKGIMDRYGKRFLKKCLKIPKGNKNPKKDRKQNGQKKKDKKTNKDPENNQQNTTISNNTNPTNRCSGKITHSSYWIRYLLIHE